ncbi:hypothetical protein [Eupransor demetentiae]|uniref:Uncharacterized protein n=1 Tax=Eupransor demetentiae TaxID=3109584 RepID=A0ABP0EPF7_9LACO|nr:hypothetical protein R54876_GBNLAHCA_00679 [Lactobacillaceae bacterium LMG 33000]
MVDTPEYALYKEIGGHLLDMVGEERYFDVAPDFKQFDHDEPIVYMGATSLQQYTPAKGVLRSKPSLTVHVFGDKEDRQTVEELKNKIYQYVMGLSEIDGYTVELDPMYTVNSVQEEQEDNVILWHGTLDVTFRVF